MPELHEIMNIFADREEGGKHPPMPAMSTVTDPKWLDLGRYHFWRDDHFTKGFDFKNVDRWWRFAELVPMNVGANYGYANIPRWNYAGYKMQDQLWTGPDSVEAKFLSGLSDLTNVANMASGALASTSYDQSTIWDISVNVARLDDFLESQVGNSEAGLLQAYKSIDVPESAMRGSAAAAFAARLYDMAKRLADLSQQLHRFHSEVNNLRAPLLERLSALSDAVHKAWSGTNSTIKGTLDNWYFTVSAGSERWNEARGQFEIKYHDDPPTYGIVGDAITDSNINQVLKNRWTENYKPVITAANDLYTTMSEHYERTAARLLPIREPSGGLPPGYSSPGDGTGAGGGNDLPDWLKDLYGDGPGGDVPDWLENLGGGGNPGPLDLNGPGGDGSSVPDWLENLGNGGNPAPLNLNGPGGEGSPGFGGLGGGNGGATDWLGNLDDIGGSTPLGLNGPDGGNVGATDLGSGNPGPLPVGLGGNGSPDLGGLGGGNGGATDWLGNLDDIGGSTPLGLNGPDGGNVGATDLGSGNPGPLPVGLGGLGGLGGGPNDRGRSPGLGTNFPYSGSLESDPGSGLPIDPATGAPYPVDPETGRPYSPSTGLPINFDPETGQVLPIDPVTGQPVGIGEKGSGLEFDPGSGLPIDPATGAPYPVDPETGRPYSPSTGLPINFDPGTGQVLPIDPVTGQPVGIDPSTGLPTDYGTPSVPGLPGNQDGLPLPSPAPGLDTNFPPVSTPGLDTNFPPVSTPGLDTDVGSGPGINPITGGPYVTDPDTGLPYPIDPVTGEPITTGFGDDGRGYEIPRLESFGPDGLNYGGLGTGDGSGSGAGNAPGTADRSSLFHTPGTARLQAGGGFPVPGSDADAPGSAPSPASSGTSPSMPMMPPMMGGMGGMGGGQGGDSNRERQRSTWLSEDERVWGTAADKNKSVLGRPVPGQKKGAQRHEFVDAGADGSGIGTASQNDGATRGRKRKPGVGNRRGRGQEQARGGEGGRDGGTD